MYALAVVFFISVFSISKVFSATNYFNFIWYNDTSTDPHNYYVNQEIPDLENATRIIARPSISILWEIKMDFPDQLDTLEFIKCGIKEIQRDTFKNVKFVKTLVITENNLRHIKQGVFNMMDVGRLNLSHNAISSIDPGAFIYMPSLTVVVLDHNELSHWFDWFRLCPKLEKVSLKYNFFETISNHVSQLRNNKVSLYFSYNKLHDIDALKNLPEMGEIYLDHNEIRDLNETFDGIGNIDILNLRGNHIECFPEELLENLSRIKSLIIGDNPVECECLRKIVNKDNQVGNKVELSTIQRKECNI